jgi:hypothetical protein
MGFSSNASGLVLPNAGELPTLAVGETVRRSEAQFGVAGVASGTLLMCVLTVGAGKGALVSAVKWLSGSQAAVTPTHQWCALFDAAHRLLAISPDLTTDPWGAFAFKTFTFNAPGRAVDNNGLYAALLMTAATPINYVGSEGTGSGNVAGLANAIVGTADTGLTTPATCPTTAAAINVTTGGVPYAVAS